MQVWQLQEAKARLSELIQKALKDGPQNISLRGLPTVVVLSYRDYEQLSRPKPDFAIFLRDSPLYGVNLDLNRDTSLTREMNL